MQHCADADCILDDTGVCTVCGVYHGEPCPFCGGAGFHRETCELLQSETCGCDDLGVEGLTGVRSNILVERVRLDRNGYTREGRYFGVGLPLYWWEDLTSDAHGYVRATTATEARRLAQERIVGYRRGR